MADRPERCINAKKGGREHREAIPAFAPAKTPMRGPVGRLRRIERPLGWPLNIELSHTNRAASVAGSLAGRTLPPRRRGVLLNATQNSAGAAADQ